MKIEPLLLVLGCLLVAIGVAWQFSPAYGLITLGAELTAVAWPTGSRR